MIIFDEFISNLIVKSMNKKKAQVSTDNVGDDLMKSISITPPIYSYVLIGILATCLIALIWGIFGSIPQRVKGVGMINTVEGLEKINAPSPGLITEIRVKLNDSVKAGDIIAIIDQPEMRSSMDQMRFQIEKLKQSNSIISSGNIENTYLKTKSNNLAIERLKANIEEVDRSIEFYEKRLAQEKIIYEKGLITYSQYFSTQQKLESDRISKISLKEQLDLITLDKKSQEFNNNLDDFSNKKELNLLELKLEDMMKDFKLKTEIVAKSEGYISQLNIKLGAAVSTDYTVGIITAHNEGKNNYILNLYVPFNSNAVISEGMNVDIQIFSVDPYLHGYLNGKVKYISDYMADNEGLMNTLGNKNLIQYLDSKGGVYSVVVELEKDPNTFNGYSWSNNEGPQIKVHPGQLSLAYVNVKVKAPIDFILPIFKAYFD